MSTLRHLGVVGFMSFQLTNKFIMDLLFRDWNDMTTTPLRPLRPLRMIMNLKVHNLKTMIRGSDLQQQEGALVVANPKEKANAKVNAKEKPNAKKQLKPENAFALISDHTYTLHLGTVSSKYCRIYILYYYISI